MRVTAETKAETRQRILDAARQLFAANGYEASTTRDIADAAGIANGTLLTKALKDEMLASAPNCIGWDCSVRNDCPDPYLCKNGDLASGNVSVWTYAGIFKCTVPVVVIVNSVLPAEYQSNEDIIGLVGDAYKAAAVPGTPHPCP